MEYVAIDWNIFCRLYFSNNFSCSLSFFYFSWFSAKIKFYFSSQSSILKSGRDSTNDLLIFYSLGVVKIAQRQPEKKFSIENEEREKNGKQQAWWWPIRIEQRNDEFVYCDECMITMAMCTETMRL